MQNIPKCGKGEHLFILWPCGMTAVAFDNIQVIGSSMPSE